MADYQTRLSPNPYLQTPGERALEYSKRILEAGVWTAASIAALRTAARSGLLESAGNYISAGMRALRSVTDEGVQDPSALRAIFREGIHHRPSFEIDRLIRERRALLSRLSAMREEGQDFSHLTRTIDETIIQRLQSRGFASRLLGLRHATVEDIGLGRFGEETRRWLQSLSEEARRTMRVDAGIFVSPVGQVIDLRAWRDVGFRTGDWWARTMIGGMLHLRDIVESARAPLGIILRKDSVHPVIQPGKLEQNLLVIGGRAFEIPSGRLVKEGLSIIPGRNSAQAQILALMGDVGRIERPHTFMGKLLSKVGLAEFLDVGFQRGPTTFDHIRAFLTKGFRDNWTRNMVFDAMKPGAAADPVRFESQVRRIGRLIEHRSAAFNRRVFEALESVLPEEFRSLSFLTQEEAIESLSRVARRAGASGEIRSIYAAVAADPEGYFRRRRIEAVRIPGLSHIRIETPQEHIHRMISIEAARELGPERLRRALDDALAANRITLFERRRADETLMASQWLETVGLTGVERSLIGDTTLERAAALLHAETRGAREFQERLARFARRESPFYEIGPLPEFDELEGLKQQYTVINRSAAVQGLKNVRDMNSFLSFLGQAYKELTAGRNRMQDVTRLTLAPYWSLVRLSDALEPIGLGLSHRSAGSTFDLFKGIFFKRAFAGYVAFQAASYLDYTVGNLTGRSIRQRTWDTIAGTRLDMAAAEESEIEENRRRYDILHDIYEPLSGLPFIGGFFDEPRTREELAEYYRSGRQAIRGGRYWMLSNTPFRGGDVDYFLPNEYILGTSEWLMTSTVYGSEEEYWARQWFPTPSHPFAPIRFLLNPYWLERCVVEGTPVLLANGIVTNIEDVKVSDLIMSHDGDAHRVEEVWSEEISEDVVTIIPHLYSDFPTTTTPEHKYLVVKASRCEKRKDRSSARCVPKSWVWCKNCQYKEWDALKAKWIRADEIEPGDYLVFPKPVLPEDLHELQIDQPEAYFNGIGFTNGRRRHIRSSVECRPDLFRLFGYYLAEGYVNNERTIILSFTDDEESYAKDVSEIAKRLFDIDAKIRYVPDHHRTDVLLHSSVLGKWFLKLFGKGAKNKRIHPDLFRTPKECLRELLVGYIRGDGSPNYDGSGLTVSVVSGSIDLIFQVRNLLLAFDVVPIIKIHKRDGRRNPNDTYVLLCTGGDGKKIREWVGWPVHFVGAPDRYSWQDDNYIYIKVRSVKRHHYEGKIYDLKVEGSHSFLGLAATFHNTHYHDRPYPVTGTLINPEIPLAPLFNATIGQIIKPQRKMHEEDLQRMNEEIRAAGEMRTLIGVDRRGRIIPMAQQPVPGSPDVIIFDQGFGAEGTPGWAVPGGIAIVPGGVASTGLPIGAKALQGGTRSTGGYVETLSAVSAPIFQFQMPFEEAPVEPLAPEDPSLLFPSDPRYHLAQTEYSIRELLGIYGFAMQTITGGEPLAGRTVLASANRMAGFQSRFWESELGGLGGSLSEIGRRFLPHPQRVEEYNPIPNQMPEWLPGPDYFVNFRTGDPYAKIPMGEIRLPGEAYEETHTLHSDPFFGDYGAFERFKILADVAPYSREFRLYEKVVRSMFRDGLLPEEWKEEFNRILEETRKAKSRYDLYEYRFSGVFDAIERRTLTVARILDASTFLTAEFPEHPIRLAGVTLRSDLPISAFLQPGMEVEVAFNADEAARYADDFLKTIRGVVFINGQNLNYQMIRSGIGRETAETHPAAILARYSPKEIAVGANAEALAHLNIPIIHRKFMPVNSALEYYERYRVYGKEFQPWEQPISGILVPTYRSYAMHDPVSASLLGAFTGGMIGQVFFGGGRRAVGGAVVGGIFAAIASIFRSAREAIAGEPYIPADRRLEREIDEYFDVLEYVKYRRLYEATARQAELREGLDIDRLLDRARENQVRRNERIEELNEQKRQLILSGADPRSPILREINRQIEEARSEGLIDNVRLGPWSQAAIYYRSRYESTLYGLDLENPDFSFIYRALPPADREFFSAFIEETDPEKRRRILELVPENQRRLYQAFWGEKVDRQRSLQSYFEEHPLPPPNWIGWRADVDLQWVKAQVAREEGVDLPEVGLWYDTLETAERLDIEPIDLSAEGPTGIMLRDRIRSLLSGRGVDVREIIVSPSPSHGITVDLDIAEDPRKRIEEALQTQSWF